MIEFLHEWGNQRSSLGDITRFMVNTSLLSTEFRSSVRIVYDVLG